MTVTRSDDGEGKGGTLFIVGIGPGLPDHLTRRARSTISRADTVYAAPLYQSFLRSRDVLPEEESRNRPNVVASARGSQARLARESFERVRAGEAVVHVSGGDPNVYGKADVLFALAAEYGYTDIEIEVVPGVTAALGGAARLGAPLGNDFAAISLSTAWRNWDEVETKLRGATDAGFVLAVYNAWKAIDDAIEVVRDSRRDHVPAAIVTDIGRGALGRNPAGESVSITTLGSLRVDWPDEPTPGMLAIIGTTETRVFDTDHEQYLVTPRGEIDLEEI